MLEMKGIEVSYGGVKVLWGVDLAVSGSEIVCLLGPNGAGKSTLMNSVSGLVKPSRGSITFNGSRIDGQASHEIVAAGIAHVLERRRLFPYLTVRQNLVLGSYLRHARVHRTERLAHVLDLFPALRDKLGQDARYLSGGQQQQVAIARGLMSCPKMLLLDEPFVGLAPDMVEHVVEVLKRLRDEGLAILFIDQNVDLALAISDQLSVLESGRVAVAGSAAELADGRAIRNIYMGL
jgi:branched-chain amino acid transport system ATP-binding protein